MLDLSIEETPARFVDLSVWPKRESVRRPVAFCQWLDWATLFLDGEEDLPNIARLFSSDSIRITGISSFPSDQLLPTLRVIRIVPEKLSNAFIKAIWDKNSLWPSGDKNSLWPSGEMMAAARTIMLWDQTENWLILNDRYYEIGVFAVFDGTFEVRTGIFQCLDQQALLERFAKVLSVNRVVALSEIEKWVR